MSRRLRIGVLTPMLDGFYFGGMLLGIQHICSVQNMEMVVFQTHAASMDRIIYDNLLAANIIDGWIVLLDAIIDQQQIRKLESYGKPIVCTPNSGNFIKCHTFTIDNEWSMYQSVKHLIEHGHRDIAIVYSTNNNESIERYNGYCQAMQDHGFSVKPEFVYNMNDVWEYSGGDAAERMLAAGLPFTAVVVSSDLTAIPMIERLQKNGVRIPEDLAVIGFDNLDSGKHLMPSLTSVRQPLSSRGRLMVEHLIKLMNGEDIPYRITKIETQLMPRESCGCSYEQKNESVSVILKKQSEQIQHLQDIILRNHAIGRNLVQHNGEQIKALTWLSMTGYHWGCLALWHEDQGKKRLVIESVYDKSGNKSSLVGMAFEENCFPPVSLLPLSENAAEDIVSVHVVNTENRKFGFLVLIGTLLERNNFTNYRYDTMSHGFDLLAHALEKEELNEAVRVREKRFRILAEQLEIVSSTSNDGIFDWNLQTGYLDWNLRIHNILGNHTDNLVMHEDQFFEHIHPNDVDGVKDMLQYHLDKGLPFDIEFKMLRADGEYIWIEAAGKAIRDESGLPYRMIGSIRDITERKSNEEVIINSEKLQIAGQLAAGIAHEMRNPLTSLKGFLQMLKPSFIEKPYYYDIMLSELNRMEQISGELLMLAKPHVHDLKDTDIRQIITDVTTLLTPQATMNDIQILTMMDADPLIVHCSDNQMKQVFINLIKNAVEVMLDGGEITVKAYKSCYEAIVEVIDQGCGIPEEQLAKIGQPFLYNKGKRHRSWING